MLAKRILRRIDAGPSRSYPSTFSSAGSTRSVPDLANDILRRSSISPVQDPLAGFAVDPLPVECARLSRYLGEEHPDRDYIVAIYVKIATLFKPQVKSCIKNKMSLKFKYEKDTCCQN